MTKSTTRIKDVLCICLDFLPIIQRMVGRYHNYVGLLQFLIQVAHTIQAPGSDINLCNERIMVEDLNTLSEEPAQQNKRRRFSCIWYPWLVRNAEHQNPGVQKSLPYPIQKL